MHRVVSKSRATRTRADGAGARYRVRRRAPTYSRSQACSMMGPWTTLASCHGDRLGIRSSPSDRPCGFGSTASGAEDGSATGSGTGPAGRRGRCTRTIRLGPGSASSPTTRRRSSRRTPTLPRLDHDPLSGGGESPSSPGRAGESEDGAGFQNRSGIELRKGAEDRGR